MPRPSRDLLACREVTRGGSKSFFLASWLLPPRVRWPAYALYAFCRAADDAVDEGEGEGRVVALTRRLDAVYGGVPRGHPVDRALAHVVAEHALPRAAFEAMFEGFAWDVAGRRYETFDDLLDYCARVASTVGVLMTVLMGRRDAATLARACDLGAAMQLTNIARDVGDDARRGRVYLPEAWLRDAGLDRASVGEGRGAELAGVVHRLLGEAAHLYRRADDGIARLPADCRWAIATASAVYAAIGEGLAGADFDAVSRRVVVPLGRKIGLAAGASLPRARGGFEHAPPLPAVRFLVDAAS